MCWSGTCSFLPVSLFVVQRLQSDSQDHWGQTTKLANIPGRARLYLRGRQRPRLSWDPRAKSGTPPSGGVATVGSEPAGDGYPRPPDNGGDKNLRHTFANTPFRGILCNPGSVFLAIVGLFKSRAIRTRRRQAPRFRERDAEKAPTEEYGPQCPTNSFLGQERRIESKITP